MDDRSFDRLSKTMAGGISRRQVLRLLGGGTAAGALAIAGLGTVHQTSAQGGLPISGSNGDYSFAGELAPAGFAIQRGQLVALGTLTGTVSDLSGVLGSIDPLDVALPVLGGLSNDTCDILNLVLGPLNLTLLGLNIFLDTVTLVITATEGALLGDLLCSISGLLSGPGNALGRLRNLLNQVLAALGLI